MVFFYEFEKIIPKKEFNNPALKRHSGSPQCTHRSVKKPGVGLTKSRIAASGDSNEVNRPPVTP